MTVRGRDTQDVLPYVHDSTRSRGFRRGLMMWALGSSVYLVAVFPRTSMGVASTMAEHRFHIGPAELSLFTVQQLVCTAVLQMPSGLFVDRIGPRRSLCLALLLMAGGQALFAVVDSFPLGIAARMLLGLGDAAIFVSVLRLIVAWCQERRIALLMQLTSVLGMAGNLVSTAPLRALLGYLGWTPTFLLASLLTGVLSCVVFGVARDSPNAEPRTPDRRAGTETQLRGMLSGLSAVWRVRGTRLGFWMHFTCTSTFMSFSLLWGYQFLSKGQGLSSGTAGLMLVVLVVASMTTGPLYGQIAATHPETRVRVVVVTSVTVAVLWLAVLAWPGHAPLPLLIVLLAALGACGPAAMVGVDIARTSNTEENTATAAALANTGGYAGILVAVTVTGVSLNIAQGSGISVHEAFVTAFSIQWLLLPFGIRQIYRHANGEKLEDPRNT